MYKIVRKSEATVREIADTYRASNYITKDVSPNISLAINTADRHDEIETTRYDRIYYVITGEIKITIDSKPNNISSGDSIFISKDTTYQFGGTFEAIVVNQPAFGT
jgi:mannose-6-phosphate isomerase-like protein (cupin superfamily)